MRVSAAILSAALGLAGVAPAFAEMRPVGMRPAPDSVEGGLWFQVDKAEESVRQSGELIRDDALNTQLSALMCSVAGEYCPEMRLYALQRPFFNATVMPNGATEVWSGLLLRAEDFGQLAFVLGHEFIHYAENHQLEAYRAYKSRMTAALVVSVGLAVAGAAAAANASDVASVQRISDATQSLVDVAYLGAIAAFFAFSRENESEADTIGATRAIAAGFDPRSGERIWRLLEAERLASDFPRVRDRPARTSIFSTHPISEERIANLSAVADGKPEGRTDAAAYRAMIRPHLGSWLRDDLRRRDFGQTLHLINRLMERGEDLGVLNFYRGETLRLRRKEGDAPLAQEAYAIATQHVDAPAAVWRQLADIHTREGRPEQARAALTSYLERAPDAPDRALIERRLAN